MLEQQTLHTYLSQGYLPGEPALPYLTLVTSDELLLRGMLTWSHM